MAGIWRADWTDVSWTVTPNASDSSRVYYKYSEFNVIDNWREPLETFGLFDSFDLANISQEWFPVYTLGRDRNRSTIIPGRTSFEGSVNGIRLQGASLQHLPTLFNLFLGKETVTSDLIKTEMSDTGRLPIFNASVAHRQTNDGAYSFTRYLLGGKVNRASLMMQEGGDLRLSLNEIFFQDIAHNIQDLNVKYSSSVTNQQISPKLDTGRFTFSNASIVLTETETSVEIAPTPDPDTITDPVYGDTNYYYGVYYPKAAASPFSGETLAEIADALYSQNPAWSNKSTADRIARLKAINSSIPSSAASTYKFPQGTVSGSATGFAFDGFGNPIKYDLPSSGAVYHKYKTNVDDMLLRVSTSLSVGDYNIICRLNPNFNCNTTVPISTGTILTYPITYWPTEAGTPLESVINVNSEAVRYGYFKVRSGDTLNRIAAKVKAPILYDPKPLTGQILKELNGLTNIGVDDQLSEYNKGVYYIKYPMKLSYSPVKLYLSDTKKDANGNPATVEVPMYGYWIYTVGNENENFGQICEGLWNKYFNTQEVLPYLNLTVLSKTITEADNVTKLISLLYVPMLEEDLPPDAEPYPNPVTTNENLTFYYYKVQSGDTLNSIALSIDNGTGLTGDDLKNINKLTRVKTTSTLTAGSYYLLIPANGYNSTTKWKYISKSGDTGNIIGTKFCYPNPPTNLCSDNGTLFKNTDGSCNYTKTITAGTSVIIRLTNTAPAGFTQYPNPSVNTSYLEYAKYKSLGGNLKKIHGTISGLSHIPLTTTGGVQGLKEYNNLSSVTDPIAYGTVVKFPVVSIPDKPGYTYFTAINKFEMPALDGTGTIWYYSFKIKDLAYTLGDSVANIISQNKNVLDRFVRVDRFGNLKTAYDGDTELPLGARLLVKYTPTVAPVAPTVLGPWFMYLVRSSDNIYRLDNALGSTITETISKYNNGITTLPSAGTMIKVPAWETTLPYHKSYLIQSNDVGTYWIDLARALYGGALGSNQSPTSLCYLSSNASLYSNGTPLFSSLTSAVAAMSALPNDPIAKITSAHVGKRVLFKAYYGGGWAEGMNRNSPPSTSGLVVQSSSTNLTTTSTIEYLTASTVSPTTSTATPSGYTTYRTYTVVSGDTLSGIAQKLGVTVSQLQSWNPEITNINLIYVGQIIKYYIAGANDPVIPTVTGTLIGYYTIKYGDTLSGIAQRLTSLTGTTITTAQLQTWNSITNANEIYAGDTIIYYTTGNVSGNPSTGQISYRHYSLGRAKSFNLSVNNNLRPIFHIASGKQTFDELMEGRQEIFLDLEMDIVNLQDLKLVEYLLSQTKVKGGRVKGFGIDIIFTSSEGLTNSGSYTERPENVQESYTLKISCGLAPNVEGNDASGYGRPANVIQEGSIRVNNDSSGYLSGRFRLNVDRIKVYNYAMP